MEVVERKNLNWSMILSHRSSLNQHSLGNPISSKCSDFKTHSSSPCSFTKVIPNYVCVGGKGDLQDPLYCGGNL